MPATQLHAIQTDWPEEKPLPSLPSPTLTNPDHILPSTGFSGFSSPPRASRRPPSPSYLRNSESPQPSFHPAAGGAGSGMGKKDNMKLRLMSRKMMLLRSRTGGNSPINGSGIPRHNPSQGSIDLIPSSPVLQDVGNLAPEHPEADLLQPPGVEERRRRASGSSSSDISGMTAFLERYGKPDGNSDDEALLYDSSENPTPSKVEIEGRSDDEDEARRQKEQEEYNSAILSKRAEQILANAKKRLNVMEGNLRGAREMVAPLTAANLKRATSLGSAQPLAVYGNGRILRYTYDYDDEHTQSSPRKLHTQQSSPSMGHDYQNYNRGYSETKLPDRPYTALDHHPQYITPRNVRTTPKTYDQHQERILRGTKSYDSLGASSGVGYGVGRERPLHSRQSPDSNHLEPLAEDDERKSHRNSGPTANNGLGIYRPSSRTSDLREQMSSLKGKISTLKERAREDSLRRQSQGNLRNISPFNNAVSPAPEFFYSSSTGYGSPVLDANAGVGQTSNDNSPGAPPMWENGVPVTGSRNAFAEQAAAATQPQQVHQARVVDIRPPKTPDSKFQIQSAKQAPQVHKRTASGTVVIDSSKTRYSHHQYKNSQSSQSSTGTNDRSGEYLQYEHLKVPPPGMLDDSDYLGSSPLSSSQPSPHIDDDYEASEDGESVYTDARDEQVVAHEDREDAFDYEHFFLHSAMGSYSNGRRGSESSEATVSSTATAKGPALVGDEEEDEFNPYSSQYPPPTPETPENLREIERGIHKRTLSDETTTTLDTFATAEEDRVSLIDERDLYRTSYLTRPHVVSPMESSSRSHSRQDSHSTQHTSSTSRTVTSHHRTDSRPGTAVKRPAIRRNSSSERADSGVGISGRPGHDKDTTRSSSRSATYKHSGKSSNGSAISSPPTSPRDPATIAVHALLDPNGQPLGLRNKAVLFGVVESLRKVVRQLQEEDESTFLSRMLRNQLDEAKRTLDGL